MTKNTGAKVGTRVALFVQPYKKGGQHPDSLAKDINKC